MARKGPVKKSKPIPDIRYKSTIISKFINSLMYDGKKSLAESLFYESFKIIEEKGSGAIVLINSNMAPNIEKIFNRRDSRDSKLELREYGVGAQILLELGLHKIVLLSNSNKKIIALDGFDLEIISQEKI